MSDGTTYWTPNQIGTAAAATTIPGQTPQYGLAYDLGTAQWISADQFKAFARDAVSQVHAAEIQQQLAGQDPAAHASELANAQGYQETGLWAPVDSSYVSKAEGQMGGGISSLLGGNFQEYAKTFAPVGGLAASALGIGGSGGVPDDAFEQYTKKGGLLTEDEFNSFDSKTQAYLLDHAQGKSLMGNVADTPGVKQGLTGVMAAYHAAVAGGLMVNQDLKNSMSGPDWLPGGMRVNPFKAVTDPNWWSKDSWSKAWQASQDQSLGSTIVDSVLQPYVPQNRLDDWKKHSSIYQLTAIGAELGVGWYADPTVLATKAIGDAARVARSEMPFEGGPVFNAATQAMQGEKITVRGPAGAYGKWRGNRIMNNWDDVRSYMQTHTLAEVTDGRPFGPGLPMFAKRGADGQAGAFATHVAANSGDDALWDLHTQLMVGAPSAYEKLNSLKLETPSGLQKFSGDARTYLDAVDATKSYASGLQKELDDLAAQPSLSFWHDWQTHRTVEQKTADLQEASGALSSYADRTDWLDSMGGMAGDKALPLVSRVGVPFTKTAFDHHFFMDNQFGWAHTFREIPRSVYIQKANQASMHDINSGVTSLHRQAEQLDHLFAYQNPEALDAALHAWHRAPTPTARADVMREFEETHLVDAAAYRFGIDSSTVRAIYEHSVTQQNKQFNGILAGEKSMYSTGPATPAERLAEGDQSIKLVSRQGEGDSETVTFALMDGKHVHQTTVPASALHEKPLGPIDPTQTVNYYTPMDTRRFFLELKRNKELLDAMDKSALTKAGARSQDILMESVDHWGQKFNALWKPLTLFRLGWPIRVMMDEGSRGMAILGPLAALREYGPDYAAAGYNALSYPLRTNIISKRFGVNRNFPIGDGPIMQAAKQSPDPFVRDLAVREAPSVPETFAPKLNRERFGAVASHGINYREWERVSARIRATGVRGKGVIPKRPVHPMDRALADSGGVKVYDPVTGRPVNTGFVVQLPHTALKFESKADAVKWYDKNAELLGSDGHRIVINPDGSAAVGRWFNGERRRMSQGLLAHVEGGVGHDIKAKAPFYSEIEDDVAEFNRMIEEAKAEDHARTVARAAEFKGQYPEVNTADYNMVLDLHNFDNAIDSRLTRAYRKISERKQTGKGVLVTRSADGAVVSFDAAYRGHEGELFQAYTSSNKTIDVLAERGNRALSMNRRQAVGMKTYHPPKMEDPKVLEKGTEANDKAIEYFQRWADMVNDQIGSSPIRSKIVKGWSDEQIVDWLKGTAQGAKVRQEIIDKGAMPELWVNEARAKVNSYLPDRELQRLLSKGRLQASDLRKHVGEDRLPDVFGPDFDFMDKGTVLGKWMANQRDRMWNALGTVPIDALSRHPFAKSMYDMKMRSFINTTDSKWLTPETIARMQDQSHRFAMDQVKRHLWDLTDQTNFTDALRFMAPFWGAQQEAIVKWGRIILDRPETLARFLVGERAVYQNLTIIDAEGNPVERKGVFYHPSDRVVMNIPSFMKHGPLGKALATIGEVGVPLSSANVVLQGKYPLLPGAGPLVTIPADKFLRHFNDTYGSEYSAKGWYKWLFPIGQPTHGGLLGMLDQVSPGWAKRIASYSAGEDDPANANMFVQVGREMELAARAKGLKPGDAGWPTEQEVADQAQWVKYLRIATGLLSPVQMEYRPKHQFLVDAWHKYQQEYGIEASDRFMGDQYTEYEKKHGDMVFSKFMDEYGAAVIQYTTSSSTSSVDIPPTAAGMRSWAGNKGLIAKYPEWGAAIVSPDAFTDDFSSPAYYAQFQLNLGPGDATKLRAPLSPKVRREIGEAQAGWMEYRKFDAAVNAELSARGLTSLAQSKAADLAQIKRGFMADLGQRYPAWRVDSKTQSDLIDIRVEELEKFAAKKEFDNRPDFQGVRQYLLIRDQVTSELDRYSVETGGSRSLQTDENTALRNWFYDQVGQLIQANPAFAEFYSRYLSADELTNGSGG